MSVLFYIAVVVAELFGLTSIWQWRRTRHPTSLVAGIALLVGGVSAYALDTWWGVAGGLIGSFFIVQILGNPYKKVEDPVDKRLRPATIDAEGSDLNRDEAKRRIHNLSKPIFDLLHHITAEQIQERIASGVKARTLGMPTMVIAMGEELNVPSQDVREALFLIAWYKSAYGDEQGAREFSFDLVDDYGIRRELPEYRAQREGRLRRLLLVSVVVVVLLAILVFIFLAGKGCV